MNRTERLSLIHDYLDGLLDGEGALEAESLMSREPQLAAAARREHALLLEAYPVPPAPPELPARIWARWRARPALALLRYAAAFAAGVLVTLAFVRPTAAAEPVPASEPHPVVFENLVLR